MINLTIGVSDLTDLSKQNLQEGIEVVLLCNVYGKLNNLELKEFYNKGWLEQFSEKKLTIHNCPLNCKVVCKHLIMDQGTLCDNLAQYLKSD